MRTLVIGTAAVLALAAPAPAQQVADTAFRPPIPTPEFDAEAGPVVAIDEAHHNFHTADGRYTTFAALLRRDGFRVERSTAPFSAASLAGIDVLVIANALAERNREDWSLPTPSAFSPEEIRAVRDWVRGGGSLLLLADHMPFPGAAEDLAREFGLEFMNGFASIPDRPGPMVFRRADGSLALHPITNGRGPAERIDSVATFTGQAFRALNDAVRPLLVFGPDVVSRNPTTAWEFDDSTPTVPVQGWLQGAAIQFGAGRVVVLGEAAMFSAQLAGPDRRPMGMNHPIAGQNPRLVLNALHWLARRN